MNTNPANGAMKIVIAIPTNNEEATIGDVIDAVRAYADEVIVIDDHSTDGTRIITEQKCIKTLLNPGRPGKGFAIRYAIDNIESDIIVFIDADGSHKSGDIPQLLRPIINGRADMVIASRVKGGSAELCSSFSELMRLTGITISSTIIGLIYGAKLTDVHNGFRAVKLDTAKHLILKEPRFAIEQEMTLQYLKKGKKVIEIPSYEFRRLHGKSHLNPLLNLFDCIRCLIRNILAK